MAGMIKDRPKMSHLRKILNSKDKEFMESEGDYESEDTEGAEDTYDMHVQELKKALGIDEEKASVVYDVICAVVEEKLAMSDDDDEGDADKPKKKSTFALVL